MILVTESPPQYDAQDALQRAIDAAKNGNYEQGKAEAEAAASLFDSAIAGQDGT